ncbi:MAG TPA: type II toxin-antitoxin system VapC family toxin [Gammaproteobacteria bacterium]|nr:type II toxin-antitoxin system VapC family toxin [Gammaproteobacteria bacterium]
MNVVDSSAWLEYFADGPNAAFFAKAIENTERLIVPSVCIVEVFKRILQQSGEGPALQAAALLQQGKIIDLDPWLAMSAAKLGHALKLPLADSIILATARAHDASIWTQDADFKDIEGVKYIAKRKTP